MISFSPQKKHPPAHEQWPWLQDERDGHSHRTESHLQGILILCPQTFRVTTLVPIEGSLSLGCGSVQFDSGSHNIRVIEISSSSSLGPSIHHAETSCIEECLDVFETGFIHPLAGVTHTRDEMHFRRPNPRSDNYLDPAVLRKLLVPFDQSRIASSTQGPARARCLP